MHIGQRIKLRREVLGFSQDELAKKLGYNSRSSINKIEKGINDINQSKIMAFAEALSTTPAYLMGWNDNTADDKSCNGKLIPVLGTVAAGVPIMAAENILDYEEISEDMAKTGEFFALQIKGSSMEPKISEGDVVVVRQQEDVESGQIAIVLVNGDDATCKKFVKHDNGISLVSLNPSFPPMFFTCDEIENKPIRIIGRVVELRAKL